MLPDSLCDLDLWLLLSRSGVLGGQVYFGIVILDLKELVQVLCLFLLLGFLFGSCDLSRRGLLLQLLLRLLEEAFVIFLQPVLILLGEPPVNRSVRVVRLGCGPI